MHESKARTAEVQTPDGWKTKSVCQVQPGEKFRMLKPDGSVVPGACGSTEFVAGSKAAQLKPLGEQLRERVRERFSGFFAQQAVACA